MQAARGGDVRRALGDFDAAANEWLRLRRGQESGDGAGTGCAAKWAAPAPRQSGAGGEAADKRADAALLT
eukprot:3577371-Lingulodinium_polyedra.AAC.1